MEGPDDMLVDDMGRENEKDSAWRHLSNLLNHDWHVAGIIEHGKGSRLFVPLATLPGIGRCAGQGQRIFL